MEEEEEEEEEGGEEEEGREEEEEEVVVRQVSASGDLTQEGTSTKKTLGRMGSCALTGQRSGSAGLASENSHKTELLASLWSIFMVDD